ncbi:MAG: hypothetical protein Kow0090_21610 [Myxococcota bacterium]
MMPIEIMKAEHAIILLVLSAIDKMCEYALGGGKINSAHLEMARAFVKEYILKTHHKKEEKILFPAFAKFSNPSKNGPVTNLLKEHHTSGLDLFGRVEYSISKYLQNGSKPNGLVDDLMTFTSFMKNHIEEEEHTLFPIIRAHLPLYLQSQLVEQLNEFDNEKIGQERLEELFAFARELSESYPEKKI